MGILEDDKAIVTAKPATISVVKTSVPTSTVNDWLTRREASKMLRCSVSKIRDHYHKKGLLHPVSDGDGVWRYNPLEVEQIADDEGIEIDTVESRQNAYARLDLMASGKLLRLVTEPIDRIQKYSTDLIDRQAKRIIELETELDRSRKARELAEDATAERETLKAVFTEREKRITGLVERASESLSKFLNGGGTPFLHTADEELLAFIWTQFPKLKPAQQEALENAAAHLKFDRKRLEAMAADMLGSAPESPTVPAPAPEEAKT